MIYETIYPEFLLGKYSHHTVTLQYVLLPACLFQIHPEFIPSQILPASELKLPDINQYCPCNVMVNGHFSVPM